MRVLMLGVNHRTASVALRERMALTGETLERFSSSFTDRYPEAELVVLSTCNRTELYVARPTHAAPGLEGLTGLIVDHFAVPESDLAPASIFRENDAAVHHLFRVAAGLDSMVIGEAQILGQVKRSYEQATDLGTVGSTLHRIFQAALAGAKQARRETGIGDGRASVGSAAADFAQQIFERFDDKTVLAVGSGEMAKVTLRHLVDLEPGRLRLVNRTRENARQLCEAIGQPADPTVADWDDLDELLVEADIVITSTGSTDPILTGPRFKPLARERRARPLFIVDIALPRDVDPEVGRFNNVYLYNLDDLQAAIEETYRQRRGEIEACEAMLDAAVKACLSEVQHQDIGRLIRLLRTRLHELGDSEKQRSVNKLVAGGLDHDLAEELLDEHTTRLINKVLHLPLSRLDVRDRDAPLGFYTAALRRLFDLDTEDTTGSDNTVPSTPEPDTADTGDESG